MADHHHRRRQPTTWSQAEWSLCGSSLAAPSWQHYPVLESGDWCGECCCCDRRNNENTPSRTVRDETTSGCSTARRRAMKSPDSVARFFSSEAAINLAVAKRMRSTLNGGPSLRYFDGATMASYQQPTRLVENVWCMTAGARCKGKHGFDPAVADVSLELGFRLEQGDGNGTLSLLVDKEISESSYLGLNESTASVLIPPDAYYLVKKFAPSGGTICDFGWESTVLVRCTDSSLQVNF